MLQHMPSWQRIHSTFMCNPLWTPSSHIYVLLEEYTPSSVITLRRTQLFYWYKQSFQGWPFLENFIYTYQSVTEFCATCYVHVHNRSHNRSSNQFILNAFEATHSYTRTFCSGHLQ
jgi:hypothetical protein